MENAHHTGARTGGNGTGTQGESTATTQSETCDGNARTVNGAVSDNELTGNIPVEVVASVRRDDRLTLAQRVVNCLAN